MNKYFKFDNRLADFKMLCKKEKQRVDDIENVMRDCISKIDNHDRAPEFMLDWKDKFSKTINYQYDHEDDKYICNHRKLKVLESVEADFLREVKKYIEQMPIKEFCLHSNLLSHLQGKFYEAMNLPF
jgi:hypothetical protein